MPSIVPVDIGDTVKLKKPHACGANEWQVTKLGMDIGLLCVSCGRNVRLMRSEFDRRFRLYLNRINNEESVDSEDANA